MTQLSTEVMTHRLKIKGEPIRYISKKLAESLFSQLTDSGSTISIVNPQTLTYVQKYKSDVELTPLDEGTRTLEEKLMTYGLTEEQKEEVRSILDPRKQEKKPINDAVIKNIVEYVKGK